MSPEQIQQMVQGQQAQAWQMMPLYYKAGLFLTMGALISVVVFLPLILWRVWNQRIHVKSAVEHTLSHHEISALKSELATWQKYVEELRRAVERQSSELQKAHDQILEAGLKPVQDDSKFQPK